MLGLRLALAISRGESWIGIDTVGVPTDVLYVQVEISEPMLHVRLKKMTGGTGNSKFHVVTEAFLKLDKGNHIVELREIIGRDKPRVIFIDPFYKVLSGDVSQQPDVTKLLDNIDVLIAEMGCSVILLAHTRKGRYEDKRQGDSDDLLGSVVLDAWPDAIIKVERDNETSNHLKVLFEVLRHAPDDVNPVELTFHRATLDFEVVEKKNDQLKLLKRKGE